MTVNAYSQFTTEELQTEEWRAISAYEGLYEVSNLGRVRRVTAFRQWPAGYIFNLRVGTNGYIKATIQSENGPKSISVHRLVGVAFLPVPLPHQTQINHKDGDKCNNRAENLEWVTPQQNTSHAITELNRRRDGRHSVKATLTEKEVLEIHELRMKGYPSRGLARMYNVTSITVDRIIRRETWDELLKDCSTDYPPVNPPMANLRKISRSELINWRRLSMPPE